MALESVLPQKSEMSRDWTLFGVKRAVIDTASIAVGAGAVLVVQVGATVALGVCAIEVVPLLANTQVRIRSGTAGAFQTGLIPLLTAGGPSGYWRLNPQEHFAPYFEVAAGADLVLWNAGAGVTTFSGWLLYRERQGA